MERSNRLDDLISEGVLSLAQEYAPEELPLFAEARDHWQSARGRVSRAGPDDEEALGFGPAETVETFLDVAFPILSAVIGYLVTHSTSLFPSGAGGQLASGLRWLFHPGPPEPLFTRDQLEIIDRHISELIRVEARDRGWKTVHAQQLRDAIVKRLALAMIVEER